MDVLALLRLYNQCTPLRTKMAHVGRSPDSSVAY